MPRKKKPDPPTQKLVLNDVSSEAIHLLETMVTSDLRCTNTVTPGPDFNKLSKPDQRHELGVLVERLIREEFVRTRTQSGYDMALNHYKFDQAWLERESQHLEPN